MARGWKDWLVPPAFQGKASGAARAIVSLAFGQPQWSKRDFANFAREGYQKNVWAYACIREVSQAVGGVPWLLYRGPRSGRRGRRSELDVHPLLTLLQKPNPEQGQAAFFESLAGFYELAGNSFLEAIGPNRPDAQPLELWTLRPDRVAIKPDARNRVGGYIYRVGTSQQEFSTSEVLHLKTWHPTDDWFGLSPVEAAARAIDHDNAQGDYEVALMQNQARPSGLLYTEKTLTEEQYNRLENKLKAKYMGTENAGRPIIAEGGIRWEQMGLTPADALTIDTGRWDALKVCAAFGVPPEVVGLVQATYQNRREARKALYTETVLPLMDRIRDDLNNWLTPRWEDRLYLDYDRDSIEALREDREKLWATVAGATWLTVNEKREATGYEHLGPEADVVLVPATQMPLEGVGLETDEPEEEPKGKAVEFKAFNLATAEAKATEWKAQDRVRQAWEKQVGLKAATLLAKDIKAMAALVAQGDTEPEPNTAAWVKGLTVLYTAIAEDFGERTLEGLKAERPTMDTKVFSLFREALKALIRSNVAESVQHITTTTKGAVQDIITEGLLEELTFPEIAAKLEEHLEPIIPKRAMVVARTEVLTASSLGSRMAAKEAKADTKEWVATPDHRTRKDHQHANGQVRKMDENYDIGGTAMMYPGDKKGGIKQVAQCRCIEVYHFADEED